MPVTCQKLETLVHPSDPARVVRVRVECPDAPSGPRPAVLVLHGFKGFMHWGFFPELSRRLAQAGYVAISLNASGSGIGEDLENFTEHEAFAHDTYSKELEDLELVRTFAAGLPAVDPGRLGMFGHSRGGGMALLHAARRGDYRAVVTWAAIGETDRIDEASKRAWREQGHLLVPNARTGQVHRIDLDLLEDQEANRATLDIVGACARLAAPTLVVHGSLDDAVPFAESERIAAALPACTHLAIEGGGHTFGATHPFSGVTTELESAFEATLEHLAQHI
jgi:uncharacterized protein